jgi:hypothetical protein
VRILRGIFRVLIVLWAGSLWSLAAWVAPTLFHAQSDRRLAGFIAAKLFSMETYLGLLVAALAIILPGRSRFNRADFSAPGVAKNDWIV